MIAYLNIMYGGGLIKNMQHAACRVMNRCHPTEFFVPYQGSLIVFGEDHGIFVFANYITDR